MKYKILFNVSILCFLLLISACQTKEISNTKNNPRPIKPYIIRDVASGHRLRYAAVTEPAQFSYLSFPIPGTVKKVNVQIGDHTSKGKVLAELDSETFLLDVHAANAEVGRINADLKAKSLELERQKKLFDKGWVSQASLDQLVSAYEAAQKSVDYVTSKLKSSNRRLQDSKLRAPYDGIISSRTVEPYQNVQAGQVILEISGQSEYKISFSVPETSLNLIHNGMAVQLAFSSFAGLYDGHIIELAQSSQDIGHYSAKARLVQAPVNLKAGMTAEVFISADKENTKGFLIPLTALVEQKNKKNPAVFLYSPESKTINLVPIDIVGAQNNQVIAVSPRLRSGQIIAAAGISFLTDHQKVRLPDSFEEPL